MQGNQAAAPLCCMWRGWRGWYGIVGQGEQHRSRCRVFSFRTLCRRRDKITQGKMLSLGCIGLTLSAVWYSSPHAGVMDQSMSWLLPSFKTLNSIIAGRPTYEICYRQQEQREAVWQSPHRTCSLQMDGRGNCRYVHDVLCRIQRSPNTDKTRHDKLQHQQSICPRLSPYSTTKVLTSSILAFAVRSMLQSHSANLPRLRPQNYSYAGARDPPTRDLKNPG